MTTTFVETNDLDGEICRFITGVELEYDNPDTLKEKATHIQKLFEHGAIPAEIKQEINQIYDYLEAPRVAVRSSATAEDLPGASFAGQYTTFLNIEGKEELYQAIKKCWASLWNERAISYRAKQNIDDANLAHGVVVQRLIDSEKSGLLFTANPVNGRRDQVSLSSSWGLGEAIVSGEVEPDQWLISKKTGEVFSEYRATKKFKTVRKQRGAETVPVEAEKQQEITLNREDRKELIELALKVEEYYEFPQDIEWAFAGGKFYLVQTRPITNLYPMPHPVDSDEELRIYMNFMLYRNALSAPLTPAGVDFWMHGLSFLNRKKRRKPVQWLKSSGGRIFVDVTEALRFKWIRKLIKGRRIPPMLDSETMTLYSLAHVAEKEAEELEQNRKSLPALIWSFITHVNWKVLLLRMSGRPQMLYAKLFPRKAAPKVAGDAYRRLAAFKERRNNLQTLDQKLDFVEHEPFGLLLFLTLAPFLRMFHVLGSLNKAEDILLKYTDDTSELIKVNRAVPNCITTEMGMEMLEIAKRLDRSGEDPSPGHTEIERFLKKYGHRSSEEVDVGTSSWRENPAFVVNTIQSYIQNKTYQEAIPKFYRDQEEAEQAIESITTQLREKRAWWDARKVKKLLREHREFFGLREMPKFVLVQALEEMRGVFREIGETLAAEGRLDHRDDVFFVSLQDIRSGVQLKEKVRQNREEYRREMQRTSVPRVITSTGETIIAVNEGDADNVCVGIPASAGVYEGVVKILKRPNEGSKLKQGEILVTMSTDPSWTPLFLKIGGLIMDGGSTMSHGAVVAREYGVPAVVGVGNATSILKDGQKVRINGESGAIEFCSD